MKYDLDPFPFQRASTRRRLMVAAILLLSAVLVRVLYA